MTSESFVPLFRAWVALACAITLAQGQGVDATPPPQPTPWRESIDKGRESLAQHLFGFQLTAFGDVLSAPDGTDTNRLDWHAFELDITGELHERLDAAAAFVTDRDGGRLTVGFLDFHPFGGTIAPRGRLWVEKGFHVQVGRFDVPFGNDWQFFASKDSVSISRPLTTDTIMDGGYNDVGLRILGNDGTFNGNAYVLRGFGDGRLSGGRIGFTPFGNPFSLKGAREPKTLELGVSFFQDTDVHRRNTDRAWAMDLEGRLGPSTTRAEYLERHRKATDSQESLSSRGWHLTQEYAWNDLPLPTCFFLRYEHLKSLPVEPSPPEGKEVRAVLGVSLGVKGILQLKAEWQHALEASTAARSAPHFTRNTWLAQLVVVL